MLERIVERLADTGRKAKRFGQYALLGLALAMPAQGCGGEAQGDDTARAGGCGNSSLTGKYVWNMENCETGMVQPFRPDCTGVFVGNSWRETSFTYQGSTLTIDFGQGMKSVDLLSFAGYRVSQVASFEICYENYYTSIDELTCGEVEWEWRKQHLSCMVSRLVEGDYMFLALEGEICPQRIFLLSAQPWPAIDTCRESVAYRQVQAAERECDDLSARRPSTDPSRYCPEWVPPDSF